MVPLPIFDAAPMMQPSTKFMPAGMRVFAMLSAVIGEIAFSADFTAILVVGKDFDAVTFQQLCPMKSHFTDTHNTNFLEGHIYLLLMITHMITHIVRATRR